jgi:cytochrome c oxidase subunit II
MAAQPPAESPAAAEGPGVPEPNHAIRIGSVWLLLSLIADLLIWFAAGPHLPPGTAGSQADGQQFDIKVMAVMAAPVMIFVLVYFLYSLVVWRGREDDEEDGPPIHGHARIQTAWITVTSVIVLCLFGFGTYELYTSYVAGAGEGPAPIYKPTGAELTTAQQVAPWSPGKPVVVQVIGQQWRFTYRYPQFGGFETTFLAVPQNQWVQFDVTSIDVIHSFWAYQLGVKADANPGVDNIAYTKPTKLGSITVRCGELCGLWHGAMYDYGQVMTQSKFLAWTKATNAHFADITPLLPPYASTYDPTVVPLFRFGKVMKALGLTSAGGGYYPPNDPAQP